MKKIFSVLLLVTFSFGIISCSNSEDSSGATAQLGQVLDQPNSTDVDVKIILPDVSTSICELIVNSVIDNSTVDNSTISDNSSIKDSTVKNCSTVTSSIIDNSSTISNSTISNSTVNNSTVCNATIDNATIDNATVCYSTIINRQIKHLIISGYDSVAPTVLSVYSDNSSANYDNGSSISINVRFNEPVFVDNSTGNPRIELETGDNDSYANYSSGNSSNVLNFIYTVVSGDNSTDLDYKSANSLSDNGSTIRDNSSNDAILTLPENGTSGSLGDNKTIVIDAKGPTAILITCSVSACINVPRSGNVTVQSTEIGTAYLVLRSGSDAVSVSNLASITGADDDTWNEVTISSASDNFTLATTGLKQGTFRVYAVDALGNLSGPSTGTWGQDDNNDGDVDDENDVPGSMVVKWE